MVALGVLAMVLLHCSSESNFLKSIWELTIELDTAVLHITPCNSCYVEREYCMKSKVSKFTLND